MLINTLFLSKPLPESDYLSKSESSDKMFGFLFSEIMNVDKQSEKLKLVPEHIGGNLIDYKSVFINYNFESNVIISPPENKETKDPIICLSKLFLEENLDNQKINEAEKIIYSPQQFVSSFTQLIKSLVENNPLSENVELKLFSKNFILSQNVDNNVQNIEKFLSEIIENESSFSLTLSASGKQILFEVFSQVVPSILTKETLDVHNTDYIETEITSLKDKPLNQILSNNNSHMNEPLSDSIFASTGEKLNTESEKESLLHKDDQIISVKEDSSVFRNKKSIEAFTSEKTNGNLEIDWQLRSNFNKVHNTEITNSLLEGNQEEKLNNTDLNKSLFSENSAIKNNDEKNSFNILPSVNKNGQRSTIELIDNSQKQPNSLLNVTTKNEGLISNNSSENPQIKIIIQSDNQNQVSSNTNVNSETISKISAILEENKGQKQSVLSAKITTNSQSPQNKNNGVNSEQFFQDNLISDRQVQNLFRSISLNKQTVQRELSSVNSVKSQIINEQSPALNLTDENVQIITQNNSVKNFNKDLSVKLNQFPENEVDLNSELKVSNGVVSEKSISDNLKTMTPTNVENPVHNTGVKKSDNILINREQDYSINTNPSFRENNKVFTKDFTDIKIDIPDDESQIINNNSINKNIVLNTSSSSTEIRKEIANEPSIGKVTFAEGKNPEFFSFNKQGKDIKVVDSKEINSNNSIETLENEEVSKINLDVRDSQNDVKSEQKTNNELASLSNKSENQKSNSISANNNKQTVSNNSLETFNNEGKSASSLSVKESQKHSESELKLVNNNSLKAEVNSAEEKVSSNTVHQVQNSFIKKSKNISSSEPVLDSHQSNSSDKSNENREIKPYSLTNLQEEVSERSDVNLKKIQKDYSSPNNVFRVVIEKPAKGIVGRSSEFVQEEKSNTENPKFNSEVPKEVKINEEIVRTSDKETPHIETKTDFNSHQEDSTKNTNQNITNMTYKESNFSKHYEESSIDFRNIIPGFEKKVSPASSRNINEVHINSNKFDFNKFFESKSLENFVRIINENNLNYRAELNNLGRNSNFIELKLYPEELGRVKILIDNSDNIVSAKIEVQSEQAKNIIISNLPQLKESLKQEGLNSQNINVYLGTEDQKGQHSANQKRQNGNSKVMYDAEEKSEEVKIKNLGYNTIEYLA